MKYAVIICSNGSFSVKSEWADLEKAKVDYFGHCKSHWNASDVKSATICIMNEKLSMVEGYKEVITHEENTEKSKVEPAEESK